LRRTGYARSHEPAAAERFLGGYRTT
jgi:hypothetical protein